MLKTLAATLIPLAMVPVGASMIKATPAKPMPVKGEIVIKLGGDEGRKVCPPRADVYEVEGEPAPVRPGKQPRAGSEADANFQKMKDKLNENFKYMFELKSELEHMQNITQNKWNEYYALRDAYEKQFKKIIADWVTDNQYLS